jgi:hypothetical protein
MEKKIPFASDVILIDAVFLDRVGKDMAAHFAPLVGRELPKADLAVLLECKMCRHILPYAVKENCIN